MNMAPSKSLITLLAAIVALLLLTLLPVSADDLRDWTNKDGRTIKAELLSVSETSITLKLDNGRRYEIPLADLSDTDRTHAIKWQAELAISPEAKKVLGQYREDGYTTEVLCHFDFESGQLEALEPKWAVLKGQYEVESGVLHGLELPADSHVATAGMDLPLGHHAVAYFEVELHEAGNVIVTLNGKGRGHVCRVVISPKLIAVQSDNKPKAVNVSRPMDLEKDETLKVVVELHNDTLSLTLLNAGDSEPLTLKDDFINHPIDNIRWAVAKGPAKIDEITVARVVSEEP